MSAGNEVSRLWQDDEPNTQFSRAAGIAFRQRRATFMSAMARRGIASINGNHRIQVFDRTATIWRPSVTGGTAGTGNIQFHGPRHIAIYDNTGSMSPTAATIVCRSSISPTRLSPIYAGTIGMTGESGEDNAHFSNPPAWLWMPATSTWPIVGTTVSRFSTAPPAAMSPPWQLWHRERPVSGTDRRGGRCRGQHLRGRFRRTARVQQFNSDRAYVRTYGVHGVPYLTDGYHYNNPSGVAVAPDGSMYIVGRQRPPAGQAECRRCTAVDSRRARLKADWDGDNDHFNSPGDVAVDAAGRVYVADQWQQPYPDLRSGRQRTTPHWDNGGTRE